jgi:hypothetical protein
MKSKHQKIEYNKLGSRYTQLERFWIALQNPVPQISVQLHFHASTSRTPDNKFAKRSQEKEQILQHWKRNLGFIAPGEV